MLILLEIRLLHHGVDFFGLLMQAHAHVTCRLPVQAEAAASRLGLELLAAIFIDEVIVLEYLAVANIYLLDLLAMDAAQLEQDPAHCLLFVYHAECV